VGAQVIGISVDPVARNRAFAAELGLTYPVLSDETKVVSKEYGVLYPLIRAARRVTFLIDRQGVIRQVQQGGEAADPGKAAQACSLLAH
jgi:thioredoxin-dependent peroxiredoxin